MKQRFNTSLTGSEAETAITLVENYRNGRSKKSKLYLQGVIATHASTDGIALALLELTYEASQWTNGNPRVQAEKDVKAISLHLKKNGFSKELVLEDDYIGWRK